MTLTFPALQSYLTDRRLEIVGVCYERGAWRATLKERHATGRFTGAGETIESALTCAMLAVGAFDAAEDTARIRAEDAETARLCRQCWPEATDEG